MHTSGLRAQTADMAQLNLSIENLSENTHACDLSMDECNHNCFH